MKNMKYFRRKNGLKGISLTVCMAMMLNIAIPVMVLAQGCGCGYPSGESGQCEYCDPDGGNLDKEADLKQATDDPIDTKTGNNYFTEERLFIPAAGIPLELNLKYQSVANAPPGRLGQGWLHDYEWSLDIQTDRAVLYTGDGNKYVFMETLSGTYQSPASNNWTLEDNGTGFDVGMPGGRIHTFDTTGKLSAIHDAWGNRVDCSYGTNDCLETVAQANGRQLIFSNSWDGALGEWRISSIEVQGGVSLAFGYNGDGQFTQVVEQVEANSYTSSYRYANGVLTNKINGVSFEYDYAYESGTSRGTRLEVDGYYGHDVDYVNATTTDVSYDLRGTNQIYRYSRNADGTLGTKYGPALTLAQTTSLGIRYDYAANGVDTTEETLFDNATGMATYSDWKLYDDVHNVTNHAVSYGTTNPVHQLSTEYDPVWQLPSAFVDAEGARTETLYTNGLPLIKKAFYSTTQSHDTHHAYTTNGLLSSTTNANEHITTFRYDAMGNQISISAGLGPISTNTYDALGFVESTEILSESGASTGRITQYDTDAKGRVVQITFADGLVSSNVFNALGYLVKSTDRAERATENTYAPTKKLTSVPRYLSEGGTNTPVRTGYDLDEQLNLLHINEPRGRYVERYQLDIQDRVTSMINIENQVMTMDYSVGDFVAQTVRFDGTSITNTYDNVGRKESALYRAAGGSTLASVDYTYYPDNETKTISDGFSSITNGYDRLNRLTNVANFASSVFSVIQYHHDPVGNLTNSVVSIGGTVSVLSAYQYDAAERLSKISSFGGIETQGFVYGYNTDNGQIVSVSNIVSGITCSYEYDLMDQATNIVYRKSDGSLIRSLEYEYDAVGMIKEKKIVDDTSGFVRSSYVYDSLDRLVHESRLGSTSSAYSTVYNYDLAGNRLSKTEEGIATTYTLGVGNRLASTSTSATNLLFVKGTTDELIGTDPRWGELWVTNHIAGTSTVPSVNGATFFAELPALAGQTNSIHIAIRDRAGNMGYAIKDYWVETAGSTNETQSFAYNAAGCLTNFNGLALDWDERYRLTSAVSATFSVSYAYDVLDRRISRIEGSTTNYFVYDGNQVVADLDGSGSIIRSYVWGTGIDNLLCFTDHTTSNTYYAIKDYQNTVIALVDEIGAVVESYEYDAYGNIKILDAASAELTESAFGNRYLFQGREYDSTTGLYYFRARWYNPETGRWLSKDPIGIAGGLNQYVAFKNNPVNNVDPKGTIAIATIIAIVSVVSAVVALVSVMAKGAEGLDSGREAGDARRDMIDALANGDDVSQAEINDAIDGVKDALNDTEELALEMLKERINSAPYGF